MKKEISILLIFSILALGGCDFLRKVASRPTSQDIQAKSELIRKRQQEVQDSLRKVQETIRLAQAARKDSLDAAARLTELGVKMSSVFSFGAPLDPLPGKFNVITGVFRKDATARSQFNAQKAKGYDPSYIRFKGGVKAVCLVSSDTLSVVASTVGSARADKVCPRDAWIYVAR